MTARANYIGLAPKAMQILLNQEAYLKEQFSDSSILSTALWELLKLRVSQINQCAFCVDMHSTQPQSARLLSGRSILPKASRWTTTTMTNWQRPLAKKGWLM